MTGTPVNRTRIPTGSRVSCAAVRADWPDGTPPPEALTDLIRTTGARRVIVLDQVGGGQGTVADAVQTSGIRVDGDGARQLAGRRAPEAVALVKVEVRSNRVAVHGIVRGCVLVEHIGHEVIRCRQHERGVAQAVLRTTGLDGKTSYAADSNCEFANQMPRVSSAYEHTTNTKEGQSRTQSKAKNDQLHLEMRERDCFAISDPIGIVKTRWNYDCKLIFQIPSHLYLPCNRQSISSSERASLGRATV